MHNWGNTKLCYISLDILVYIILNDGAWDSPSVVMVTEADAASEGVPGAVVTTLAASLVDLEDRMTAVETKIEFLLLD